MLIQLIGNKNPLNTSLTPLLARDRITRLRGPLILFQHLYSEKIEINRVREAPLCLPCSNRNPLFITLVVAGLIVLRNNGRIANSARRFLHARQPSPQILIESKYFSPAENLATSPPDDEHYRLKPIIARFERFHCFVAAVTNFANLR